MIFLNSFNKSVNLSQPRYGTFALQRAPQKSTTFNGWAEAIFLAIINIIAISCNISVSYVEGGREKYVEKIKISVRPPRRPCKWQLTQLLYSIGSFRNDDGDGNQDVKKAIGLLRKTQLCTCITLFCTFLHPPCTTTT